MTIKQEIYDKIGRETVNNFPRYREDIIRRHVEEAEGLGIKLRGERKEKIKPTQTVDMFPNLPSSRKDDL